MHELIGIGFFILIFVSYFRGYYNGKLENNNKDLLNESLEVAKDVTNKYNTLVKTYNNLLKDYNTVSEDNEILYEKLDIIKEKLKEYLEKKSSSESDALKVELDKGDLEELWTE